MSFKIAVFSQLTKISLSGSLCKTKLANQHLSSDFSFIRRKYQDVGQFVGQRRFYRPFIDHFLLEFLFIDHFCINRLEELVDIVFQMIRDAVVMSSWRFIHLRP